MPLLLGADNQVAMRKNCLDMGRDPLTLGKTAFAVIMPAKRPQVGAIVDIEGHSSTGSTRHSHRSETGAGDAVGAEMRSGHENRLCRGNEIRIDFGLIYRHVGAVLAIEDQRELLAVGAV